MNARRSRILKATGSGILAGVGAIVAIVSVVYAQAPPTHTNFYGTVQLGGANISPAEQPVLALVDGHVCGSTETIVVPDDPQNPPGDIGKTAYVIDVMADGSGIFFERPGCGEPGDDVRFYFPEASRIALQVGTFTGSGSLDRLNLMLGPELSHSLAAPMMTKDGSP